MNRFQRGMTLVELLIVLTILAGLVTMVAVNASGLQNRRRANNTERVGAAVADAWMRYDGLSFVSDFGQLPTDEATLQLLFRQDYPAELKPEREPDTGFEATTTGTGENEKVLTKRAPAFRVKKLVRTVSTQTGPDIIRVPDEELFPGLDSADRPKLSALLNSAAFSTKNEFSISLPCGWRGPYCESLPTIEKGVATDGFGGAWHLTPEHPDADGNTVPAELLSYGQDRTEDENPLPETHAWQDTDRRFILRSPAVTLTLNITLPGDAVTMTKVHVFGYAPASVWPTGLDASEQPTVKPIAHYFKDALNGSAVLKDGLTVGTRAFFVWAEASDGTYYLPPRYLTLKPGNNSLKGTLRKAL